MTVHHALAYTALFALHCALPAAWGHSATDPAPRGDQGWQDRQKLLNQRAAEAGEKAQVIFIGDSITQGWEGAGKDVWAKYYANRKAVNLGIGGDRTQHVLWRLDNGNLAGLKPKAGVVMIGTNNSNAEDNTVEQIAAGVTAIVQKLRDKLPDTKILLLAIFPRGENPQAQRGKLLQVNQILQKLGDNERVFFVDFGHKFVTADGLIPTDLMPDYLHLTPKAYGIWAESIEGLLSLILGDTPVLAGAGMDLTGDWIWTIRGPDGNPMDAALVLKQEGARVTGRFARDANQWLEIENGKAEGNRFSWSVQRDRPSGGTMTYEMTGQLEDGKITGKVKTRMDGNESVADWSARRK
jgi:lysophospholipase L1-like esterase